jgi:hypothetical protein
MEPHGTAVAPGCTYIATYNGNRNDTGNDIYGRFNNGSCEIIGISNYWDYIFYVLRFSDLV